MNGDDLSARWNALVQAVEREFEREGRTRGVPVTHDLRTLRLSARRPLSHGREEWVSVNLKADEVLTRAPGELAREFARSYYACT
jgi:hypothetical protein